MRASILLNLVLAGAAIAAPPELTIPAEITPADGYAIVEPATTAKSVSYVPLDQAKGLPARLLADRRTLVVGTGGLPPGRYRFVAVASLNDEQVQAPFAVVIPGPAIPGAAPPAIPPAAVGAPPRVSAVPVRTADPAATTCQVGRPGGGGSQYSGSGTCIACENGQSLVLTNNHIFSDQPRPGAQFPAARCPVNGSVRPRGDSHSYPAACVAADPDADLAILVAEVEMPVAELADDNAPVGTQVRHWGCGSGGGSGRVLDPGGMMGPAGRFASSAPSINGDSGAGLFDADGRLVAVNWGRDARSQRGTPVRNVVRGILKGKPPAEVAAEYAPVGRPVYAAPAAPCPTGRCPQVRQSAEVPAGRPAESVADIIARIEARLTALEARAGSLERAVR